MEASLSAQRVVQDILSKQSQLGADQLDNKVNPEDVEKFQKALQQDISKLEVSQPAERSYSEEVSSDKGVGDKILNNISDLKSDYKTAIERVRGILDKGSEVSMSDMLKVQMDLMVMSLKQETVGKITQKSSQNLDSLLKSG